jgi:peptidoglycan/xylan/chitin deacetylase (PgdA/CDA1 family)
VLGTVVGVSTREPLIALTFDDGPSEYTPQLLDILVKHRAQVTFFMVGKQAEQCPDIVNRVIAEGHEIGNHSWDHQSFTSINGPMRREQIRRCAKALAPHGQSYFRPPFGHQSVASRIDAFLLGYRVVAWNVHAEDWSYHNPQYFSEQLIRRVHPGCIVLLHDALYNRPENYPQKDRKPMIEALDIFLGWAGEKYRFVTLSNLFNRGKLIHKGWYRTAQQSKNYSA